MNLRMTTINNIAYEHIRSHQRWRNTGKALHP